MSSIVFRVRVSTASLAGGQAVPDSVARVVQSRKLAIAPQFSGAVDPDLSRYFVVTASSADDLEKVAAELRALPDVDAAYVQPDASPAAP